MLAIVTMSAFQCDGTSEGLESLEQEGVGSILYLRSPLPGQSWHMGQQN